MQNKKLFNILRVLSIEQFKRLQRATLSSYHDGNPTAQKTYQALSPYYPNFELSPKDIRKVYTKLFPKKAFNPRNLEKYFNLLLKTTESFLLYLKLEEDDFLYEKSVSKTLFHPNMFDLFEKSQDKQHKILEERACKDAEYWYEKKELYDNLYAHRGHEKYDVKDDTHNLLNEASDRLYMHYRKRASILLQENALRLNSEYYNDLWSEIQNAQE